MSSSNCLIVHFTTVHPRDDSRIRTKQVASLASKFAEVRLLVQDGLGDEIDPAGYRIVDTGPRMKRIPRMVIGGWRMFRAVRAARPQVAHFHDPELLPWALLLKLSGISIVYDVHEDMPQQVKHNPGLPPLAQRTLSPIVRLAEWFGALFLDGVVACTETIKQRFPVAKTVLVRNFPILEELAVPSARAQSDRLLEFAYVGYISEVRNIFGMMRAVDQLPYPDARLRLAGSFAIEDTERQAMAMREWQSVRFEGWASRSRVAQILSEVRAGLVVLKPVEHEMLTLPIKLFEYMAAGLPVISSDFPLWRSIIEDAGCGLLVDPLDSTDISRAMRWIIEHPDEAQAMGARGRAAIETRYHWRNEADTLTRFYRSLMPIEHHPPPDCGAA